MNEPKNPLDALADQAQGLEASEPDQNGAAPPASITNEQAIAGAIAAGREAFCFFTKLESPRRVLDDSNVQQLAALWAPVADKHGFNLGDYLGDYALEIAAAIGTISIAAQLRKAVSLEVEAIKDKAPAPAPAAQEPAPAEPDPAHGFTSQD